MLALAVALAVNAFFPPARLSVESDDHVIATDPRGYGKEIGVEVNESVVQ